MIVVLTTCASDERVYGPSARLPDEPAHMGCRMLAHLREAACPGALGPPRAAADGLGTSSESFSIRRTFTGRAAADRVLVVY